MDLMLLSFFHFYVVLFNFLWLAGLLMDMQWPRLPLIYIFSHYVFCLSRRYVSLNGHDRDHLQRLLSFFFITIHKFPCTLLQILQLSIINRAVCTKAFILTERLQDQVYFH